MIERLRGRVLDLVAVGQGIFYLVTGLWPFVTCAGFEKITGPKVDFWLVQTAGALITVIGGVLLSAGLRRQVTPELAALGAGSAAGLASIDIVYTRRGRISPVYLLDALAELSLIALWAVAAAASGYQSKQGKVIHEEH